MKSAFLLSKGLLCLSNKQNNTWLLVDMEFLFSCSTRHLTRSLRSLVSYRVKHTKRNSISTRAHVLFSISRALPISSVDYYGGKPIQCAVYYLDTQHMIGGKKKLSALMTQNFEQIKMIAIAINNLVSYSILTIHSCPMPSKKHWSKMIMSVHFNSVIHIESWILWGYYRSGNHSPSDRLLIHPVIWIC